MKRTVLKFLGCGLPRRPLYRYFLLWLFLLFLANTATVQAHYVGQSQTSKFFAPETVQMLQDRASGVTPGGAGIRQGDILSYIVESVPAPAGATFGSAGYATDYIPPGTQVVGAHFVENIPDPTKPGGFAYIDTPMPSPGVMADGWGVRGTALVSGNLYTPPFLDGRLAQSTQDTGIFFSTDPRTARIAIPYDITLCTKAGLIGTQAAFLLYSQWDYDQMMAFGNSGGCLPIAPAPYLVDPKLWVGGSGRGNPPVLSNPLTGLSVGVASPVAGPDTYYTNDFNPAGDLNPALNSLVDFQSVGPWQRIYTPGALIAGTGPILPALAQGAETITGVPTSAGLFLSPGNPLPAGPVGPLSTRTNAVRFAFGERSVGTVEHVRIDLKIVDLAAFAAGNAATPPYTNQSSVFGGDASGGAQGGKDHVIAYLGPSQANNSAQLALVKSVVATSLTALGPWAGSSGIFVKPMEFVKYRITYLNANSAPLTSVIIKDLIDPVEATFVSASTGNPFLGAATPVIGGVAWPVIPVLSPGMGGTVEVVVQITGGGFVTQNTANAVSVEIPIPGVSASAVSTINATGAPPVIKQTKSVFPSNGIPGTALTYTLTLNNYGGGIVVPVVGNINPLKGPVYPATAGIGLVIGDTLPKTTANPLAVPPVLAVNNIVYTATTLVQLTDTVTGLSYPLGIGNYTVDLITRPGDVFWSINTYPVGHPLAGLPFSFINSRLDITFTAAVAATALPGIYSNQAESYVGDIISNNDISKFSAGLAPVAVSSPAFDVFSKAVVDVNGGSLGPGDVLRYDFTLTNTGSVAATNFLMTDPLPGNSAFVVGSLLAPGATITYSNNGGLTYLYSPIADVNGLDATVTHVQLNYGSIAVLATLTPSLKIKVNAPLNNGIQLLNQATATVLALPLTQFFSDDPAQPGTQDFTIITVAAAPDYSTSTKTVLVNSAVNTSAQSGDTLSYSIHLLDTGNQGSGATNVQVVDTVDLTVLQNIVLSPVPAGWSVLGPDINGKITWYIGSLAQGSNAPFGFTADVKVVVNGTSINNTAIISSTESNPVNINAPTVTVPLTQVLGTIFSDLNSNGIQDVGDTGLQGVTLALRIPGFTSDIATATTDASGAYTLIAPLAGNWDVVITDAGGVLTGRTDTSINPSPLTVTLSNGQSLANQDFSYHLPAPATLNGRLFDDANGNQVQDGGELGLNAVTLELKNNIGTVIANVSSNASGDYSFTGLVAGNYTLTISDTGGVLVNRFITTVPASPVTITALGVGATLTTNFAYRLGSQIGDLIFDDANGDGLFSVGETGISGVTLELRPTGGGIGSAIANATTDVTGAYLFQAVPPNTYDVVITDAAGVLTGFLSTTVIASPHVGLVTSSGVNVLNIDFGYTAAPVIAVTKTVDKGVAGFNEGLQYTITVSNTGGAARNFIVRDILPEVLPALPYTASANNFLYLGTTSATLNGSPFTIPALPTSLSNQPTWSGFTLPGASTLQIIFTAFTGSNEGLNYNGVKINYNNAPPVVPPAVPPADTVIDFPNLVMVTISNSGTVTKQVVAINAVPWTGAGTPTVAAGDVITYRVTLENSPAAIVQTVPSITDLIPVGFVYQVGSSTLVSALNPPPALPVATADPTVLGQLLTWTFIAPGPATAAAFPSTLTLDFNLIAPTGVDGTFTDNATVNVVIGAALPVPVPSGDTAPVTVTQFRIGDLVYIDNVAAGGTAGVFDAAFDTAATNVTVELRPVGGGLGSAIATTTTDINGNYNFLISTAGNYDVVLTDTSGVLLGHTATTAGGNTQSHAVTTLVPSILTADFGYQPPIPSTLTGTVFADTNGNTLIDVGETGYAGVTVQLLNLFSVVVNTVTTDALGNYSFGGIPGGVYQVNIPTAPVVGLVPTVTVPLSVTVADGSVSSANNIGYQAPAIITGRVFSDVNASGSAYDGGVTDVLLSGVTVWLKNIGTATVVATATTDVNGVYTFANLPLNGNASIDYDVDVDQTTAPISNSPLTAGADPTTPVTIISGNTTNVPDIGFQVLASVAGTVYDDRNGSLAFDVTAPADVFLGGATVNVYNAVPALVGTTTSSAVDGSYFVGNLAPGNYTIEVVTPTTYTAFSPAATAPVLPTRAITLVVTQQLAGQDFGFFQAPATVTGRVFSDVDASGAFNAGDGLLSGVTVSLKIGATTIATATTNASGVYSFTGLTLDGNASITFDVSVNQAAAPINGDPLTAGVNPSTAIITAGNTTNVADIGFQVLSSISGTVYDDKNGTLAFDATVPADVFLANATVNLYDVGMALIATTTSSAVDGSYQFLGLGGNTYTVEVITPATLTAVSPAAVLPLHPRTTTTLASAQQFVADFGFSMQPNLQVTKTTPSNLAALNSTIVYTVTVTNTGGVANNVVITDYLPSLAAPAGWLGLTPPTPSASVFTFPAAFTPRLTTATLNGLPVIFTELAGVGSLSWSTALGGFTLANGDVLQIIFAVDEPNKIEGSYFNSLSVTEGALPATTTWYPDINSVIVTKTYITDKQVVAVNGIAWGGGVPNIDVGDTVTYQIQITNLRGKGAAGKDEIAVQTLTDTLPLGFKYVPGTEVIVSPGNLTPNPLIPVILPLVTPATALTSEIINYTFSFPLAKTAPLPPNVLPTHMMTGPSLNDTASLRFDAIAYDAVSLNAPLPGNHPNRVTVSANRAAKVGVLQTVVGATVNVTNNAHVKGFVFHNLNGNLIYDAPPLGADQPFNGVTVELQPAGGGAAIDSMTLAADGAYDLVAPGAGSYQVVITDTAGILSSYSNTLAPTMPITLTNGQQLLGQNYGYVVAGTPASITGTVFNDANLDGLLNGAETGIAGVTVWLKTTGGVILNTAITPIGGTYSFTNLPAGNYVLDVDQTALALAGLFNTPAATPTEPANVTAVAAGTTVQNFGWALGSIFSGTVFDDANNDGLFTLGEPGHGNVTLNLVDTATATVLQTVTSLTTPIASLGTYRFTAVPVGSYRIDVTDTNGEMTAYALTSLNQPMTAVVSVGGTNYVTNFGYFLAPLISVSKTMTSTTLDRGSKMDVTLTVTNTGGGVSAFSLADVLPAAAAPASPFIGGVGLFTASFVDYEYEQTASVLLNGVPLVVAVDYVAPLIPSLTPTWGNIALPGGSVLTIHFTAKQPIATAGATGGPNYNGASIQYGALPTVVDYPDLVLFSTVRDVNYSKTLALVNDAPVTGTPIITAGDKLTFDLKVANTIKATPQTVISFIDALPADLLGNGLTYIPCAVIPVLPCSTSKLTDPTTATVLALIGHPLVTPGVIGTGISQTLTWSLANASWLADPATLATFPSEIVLRYEVFVGATMPAATYSNSSNVSGIGAKGPFVAYGSAPFTVSVGQPLLTIVKSSDVTAANPGQVVTYTIQVVNTGVGAAINVLLTDNMSAYTNMGLNSFGAGLPFQFIEGTPASTLTLGTPVYSNDNATTFAYTPASGAGGATAGFDRNVTDWKTPMTGTMPSLGAFSLKYKTEVQ